MMSIFSPFDALSAEVCGQKLSFSKALTTHDTTQQGVGTLVTNSQAVASPPSTSSLNKAGEASSSPQNQQKRQRFALEFDGVHCFETIITYWFLLLLKLRDRKLIMIYTIFWIRIIFTLLFCLLVKLQFVISRFVLYLWFILFGDRRSNLFLQLNFYSRKFIMTGNIHVPVSCNFIV